MTRNAVFVPPRVAKFARPERRKNFADSCGSRNICGAHHRIAAQRGGTPIAVVCSMRSTAPLLFAILAACSSHDDSAEDFQRSLDDASAELDRHLATCTDASSDAVMTREIDRHEQAMHGLLRAMHDDFGMMEQCYRGDPTVMKGLLDDLSAAQGTHRDRVDSAATLDEAHAECERYVSVANRDVGQMHDRLRTDGAHCMMM